MRLRWTRLIFSLLIYPFVPAKGAPASQEWRLRYAELNTKDPESCLLEPERGLCYAAFTLYYFDAAAGTCEEFLYGGCGGNANRFGSFEECQATCARSSDVPAAGATPKPAEAAQRRRGDAASSSSSAGFVVSHANGDAGLDAAGTRLSTKSAHAAQTVAVNRRKEPASANDGAASVSLDLLPSYHGDQVWDAAWL
ncbi:hypothetical protein MRX96_017244 [Rhipicephalus microplus]